MGKGKEICFFPSAIHADNTMKTLFCQCTWTNVTQNIKPDAFPEYFQIHYAQVGSI